MTLSFVVLLGTEGHELRAGARWLRIVSEVPPGERPMLLDVRLREREWDGDCMSLADYELMNGAAGTRRWELLFVVTPDSSALQLGSGADHAYISVHTPVARTRMRIAISDTNSVVLTGRFEKPAGPERVLLRWDLADSTGRRLPSGWYWIEAAGQTSTMGMVRLMDRPLPPDLRPSP